MKRRRREPSLSIQRKSESKSQQMRRPRNKIGSTILKRAEKSERTSRMRGRKLKILDRLRLMNSRILALITSIYTSSKRKRYHSEK